MPKVISAKRIPRQRSTQADSIMVTLDGPFSVEKAVYRKAIDHEGDMAYLGFDGDVGWFCLSTGNKRGFAGHTFNLPMEDGSVAVVVGPWSSRASCIGPLFPDCEFVEVTTQDHQSVVVKRDVLTALGVATELSVFNTEWTYDTEQAWYPVRSAA